MAEEILELDFAINIPERPLIEVRYNFQTGAVDSDLVQSTFEQYGVPCDKDKTKRINRYWDFCYPARNVYGKNVCENGYCVPMDLETEANLLLDPPSTSELDPVMGPPGLWLQLRRPEGPGGTLILIDTRIAKADKKAGEAAHRANNPPPKF